MNRLLFLIIVFSNLTIANTALSATRRSSQTNGKHDETLSSTKHQLFAIPGHPVQNKYSSPLSSVYCPINPSIYALKSVIISNIGSINWATLSIPGQPRSNMNTTKTRNSTLVFNNPPSSQCYLLQLSSPSYSRRINILDVEVQFIYDTTNVKTDETTSNELTDLYVPPKRNTNTTCESIVCKNGGHCLSLGNNRYECQCDSRGQWLGTTCSIPNPCLRKPCNNAGRCHYRRDATYYCVCSHEYSGKNCQISSTQTTSSIARSPNNPCLSSRPCLNGGTCVYNRLQNTFTCTCPNRYSGPRCQYPYQSTMTTTSPPNTCGICQIKPRIDFGDRIVNGQSVYTYVWPWIVSLQNRGSHFCGGTLIDPLHVITAAHCFDTPGASLNGYEVVAGLLNLRQSSSSTVQKFSIDRIFRHEQYSSTKLINDIAIIKLRKPAKITSYVYPICLPNGDSSQDPKVGQIVQIAGWGYTSSATKQISPQLQEAYIEILNPNGDSYGGPGCSVWAKRGNPMDKTRQICAMSRDTRTDSCQGDSGGPLIRNINTKWYLFGIVSYGDAICASSKAAGVYTRVSAYIPWIQQKLKL